MNHAALFAALRSRGNAAFGTSLSQAQVQGIEAVLAAGDGLPLTHLAYALATAHGETGGRMQPIHENLNYTSADRLMEVWPSRFKSRADALPYVRNPEGLANLVYGRKLGNTQPGDGWRYRGRGLVQITGKDNYAKVGRLIGADLVADPDAALDLGVAARALIFGIRDGTFPGKRAADYLPGDYVAARRIINGTFEARRYADLAMGFESALRAGGYEAAPPPRQPAPQAPEPAPAPTAPPQSTGPLAALLALLRRILGGKA